MFSGWHPLTPQQVGIAACLLDALGDKEIARAMQLSDRTVTHHMQQIKRRLGARNRVDAALRLRDLCDATTEAR